MALVIYNNANPHDASARSLDQVIAEGLKQSLRSADPEHHVTYSTSFEEARRFCEANTGSALLLLTNLPPDSTYNPGFNVRSRTFRGHVITSVEADSYGISLEHLRNLVAEFPNLTVVVVTGAPAQVLPDHVVFSLGPSSRIRLKRKRDLMQPNQDWHQAYFDYLCSIAKRVLSSSASAMERDRSASSASSLKQRFAGAIRVLVLSDRERLKDPSTGHYLAEYTVLGSPESYGAPMVLTVVAQNHFEGFPAPFSFFCAHSLEEAQGAQLEWPFELVLGVRRCSYWRDFVDNLRPRFGVVWILGEADDEGQVPFSSIVLRPGNDSIVPYESVFNALLARVKQGGSSIADARAVQRRFIEHISAGELAHGLRGLALELPSVMETFGRDAEGDCLFLPVASAAEMRGLVPQVVFMARRTVFTYLPLFESVRYEGVPHAAVPLWEVGETELGTFFETEIIRVILEYSDLFAEGSVCFLPAPSLTWVARADLQGPLSEADFPVMELNDHAANYINADAVSGWHATHAVHKPLSTLGTEVASINFPYVHGVDGASLASIVRDYGPSVAQLRQVSRRRLRDLLETQSEDERVRLRRDFKEDIENSMYDVSSQMDHLRRSTVFEQGGAALLTSIAALAMVGNVVPQEVSTLLGSAGLGAMGLQYLGYLRQRAALRKSAASVLWKLRAARKRFEERT